MWSILGVICSVAILVSGQAVPQVTIAQGDVIGSVASDGDYFEFHGIPYADSTSGSHRFKAPTPPPSFETAFVANRRDVRCVRAMGVGYEGTEDCLVANVFTPSLNNDSRLPVMVWIKGKEFDTVYEQPRSFRNFMEHEVVVVSLNFRESILGFLCLGTETAPGNAGLKDIIAGLRWVKDNIAAFGGNPDDITLFGHGSGAAAVDLVTLSPMAEGLITKAISQSGNAFAPWAVTRNNLEYAVEVAEALGHTVDSLETLSEVFTRTSVAALMAVINELDLTDNSLAFAPCLERPELEESEPFLLKSPYQTITDGDFLQIPFMTGFVDHEGTIKAEEAVGSNWIERMATSFMEFLQPDLKFDTIEEKTQVAGDIRRFYFGDDPEIDVNEYLDYHGDTMIVVSTLREARLRSQATTQPIYLYQFSYKGTLGEPFFGPVVLNSAAHTEELAYLFYETPNESEREQLIRDLAVGDILVERWTNFAKTGDPFSEISTITWSPFSIDNPLYLRFLDNDEQSDEEIVTFESGFEVELQNPHADAINFWNHIYEEHFLDAEGRWQLNTRDEDEVDGSGEEDINSIEGDNDNENTEDVDEGEGDTTTESAEGNGEEDADTDSASTAIGYTFLIISLFAILGNFHSSQILS